VFWVVGGDEFVDEGVQGAEGEGGEGGSVVEEADG
jgi:hypothetical protein